MSEQLPRGDERHQLLRHHDGHLLPGFYIDLPGSAARLGAAAALLSDGLQGPPASAT